MNRFTIKKILRGAIKDCLPYSIQRWRAARVYGLFYPNLAATDNWKGKLQKCFFGILPFGLVRRIKGLPQDGSSPAWLRAQKSWKNTVRYHFPGNRKQQLRREIKEGLTADAALIERNKNCSILVILHLFYDKSWQVIREYLKSLDPYNVTWVFTVTENCISEKTLSQIRAAYPAAKIISCENRGFDLWPFIKVLNQVDLSKYDIVYKMHSKGISRPYIFIYHQIFKYSDWFFNLFDGILGGRSVHRAIDMLMNENVKLTAAENLIVNDPKHKVSMVRKFCQKNGLPFCENYRFIAGTCFAARSEVLLPLQKLALTEDDFALTARGTFSLAHVIERWLCFAAADAIQGISVPHPVYPQELKRREAVSALRMLDDDRFILDDEFFFHTMEMAIVQKYGVVRMKLKDIRRKKLNGEICSLAECEPFHYLCGATEEYDQYCQENQKRSSYAMNQERFEQLIKSMDEAYDPRCMPVIQGKKRIIRDGQHRCCVLLKKYGPEHEIDVLHYW